MKCKPYSEITVEIRTQLKTVKITSNIFAVLYKKNLKEFSLKIQKDLETAKYIKIFANNLFYIWRE